jgi:hypothetical protein
LADLPGTMVDIDLKRIALLPPALQLKILSLGLQSSGNHVDPAISKDHCNLADSSVSVPDILHSLGTCGYVVVDNLLLNAAAVAALRHAKVN